MHDWSGKIIVITGAGSGLGQALARLFAREGALLILTDVNPESLMTLTVELDAAVMLGGLSCS